MKNHSKKTTLIGATVAALFLASSAQAFVGESISQDTVNIADLNMTQVQDQKVLQKRLQASAEKVCGVNDAIDSRSISRIADSKRCYRDSIEAAMKTVSLASR